MKKHPVPPHLRKKRKQALAGWEGAFPLLSAVTAQGSLLKGYSVTQMTKNAESVTLSIYNQNTWMIRAKPQVTAPCRKYAALAAVRKLIAEDQKAWKAAEEMCKAIGLFPMEMCPYPFGPMMAPAGVMPMGPGVYVGSVPPEMRPAVQWMYPHALAIRAAQRAFAQ